MAGAPLSCYELREKQLPLLVLDGTLDVSTCDQALSAIQKYLLEKGPTIVLDGSRLDFIDSKGVGTLLTAVKSVREVGGKLYLHSPSVPARKILELCGVNSLFPEPPEEMREAKAPAPDPSLLAPRPASRPVAPSSRQRRAA